MLKTVGRDVKSVRAAMEERLVGGFAVGVGVVIFDEYVRECSALVDQVAADFETPVFVVFGMGSKVVVIGRSQGHAQKVALSVSSDSLDEVVLHVGRVCQSLGGGGHRDAGSATLTGYSPAEAEVALCAAIHSEISGEGASAIMSQPASFLTTYGGAIQCACRC